MEKVNKIKVSITQKMNLGNYETQDYSIGLEIEGFNPEVEDEVQDAIDYGRDLCFKNIEEYYERVKGSQLSILSKNKEKDRAAISLSNKINAAETVEELEKLRDDVKSVKDEKAAKIVSRNYNLKMISLKE